MKNYNWEDFFEQSDRFIQEWSESPEECARVYLQASGGEKSFLYEDKDFMPEPFLGNPVRCSAVMLNLNPADPMRKFHKDETYAKRIIDDRYSKRAKEFSIFEEGDGGYIWWKKRIDWLNRVSGKDENLKPFVVEICPWHSTKWGGLDYENKELVKKIEEKTLIPAFYAVQNAKINNCVIAIGKDYCEVLSRLGFKEEVKFIPSGEKLEVSIKNVNNPQISENWKERWPRNKKQELSNRAFAVFRKGENRILCIWSNKGGSNKPPQKGFDKLVKALISGTY